nr:hypothetical protein [Sphingobacterium sp.]
MEENQPIVAWARIKILFPIGTVPELFLKEPLCIAHHNVWRDPYVVFILPVEQFIF